jgi:hypothetical protein
VLEDVKKKRKSWQDTEKGLWEKEEIGEFHSSDPYKKTI